jgi:nucleoside-diphosphate-sugar epimerase
VTSSRERVLLLGGAGFLGPHFAAALRAAGADVIVAGRSSAAAEGLVVDVTNDDEFARALELVAPDVVLNCAGYGVKPAEVDEDLLTAVNAVAPARLLARAASAGVRRFAHLGSCSEYGEQPVGTPIEEDATPAPLDGYGRSKLAGTRALQGVARGATSLVVARLFTVFGPGEGAWRLVPSLRAAAVSDQPVELTRCEAVRDYLFVADMARAIARLVAAPATAVVVNVGSGEGRPLRELVSDVAEALGLTAPLAFGALTPRRREPPWLVADIRRLIAATGPLTRTELSAALRAYDEACA